MCLSLWEQALLNLHSQKKNKTNIRTDKRQARKIQTRNQIQAEKESFIHV